jgi:glycerol-3-phosphate dehydrogenase
MTESEVHGTKAALNLAREFGIDMEDSAYLVRNYGIADAKKVCEIGTAKNSLNPLIPNQRVMRAELEYAAKYEMAETVCDIIGHRTRLAFVEPRETRRILSDIVEEIGSFKNWSTDRKIAEFEQASHFLSTMEYAGSVQPETVRRRSYIPVAE